MNIFRNPEWKKNLIYQNLKIKDAIKILNQNKYKIVIVVDKKKKFIGTITNGDIRRGLIKGFYKNDKLFEIVNKKSIVLNLNHKKRDVINLFTKYKIGYVPIIKKNKEIIGIYAYQNPKKNLIKDTLFLVMAGGKGKRLLPLTKNNPKPMLKILGKPIAEKLIEKALKEGFRDFIFSVNYLSHKIINHFRDGKKWGAKIAYIKETIPLGTIGCLANLENFKFKNIVVVNCDVVTKLNFSDLLSFHDAHQQLVTVVSVIHTTKNQFGIMKTKGSRLIEMIEKPLQKNFVNGGIYVFKKEIIKNIKKNKRLDINDLFKKIIQTKKKIIVYPLHEFWSDVGDMKELKRIKGLAR
jgi:dTDP-glucose pyrophosphorylase